MLQNKTSTKTKNLLILTILLLAAYSNTYRILQQNSTDTPVSLHGRLRVQNGKIVDKHGEVYQLTGMSMFWSQWAGAFWNTGAVDWMVKDWKINLVRAAMAVNRGGYLTNKQAEKDKVITVVDQAIKNGIYVIIDWHVEGDENNQQEAEEFFKEMATLYKDVDNVIYETWNEPISSNWDSQLKPYHEALIKTIRATGAKQLVVCGTDTWSQGIQNACHNPILMDENVAYTLHFYVDMHKQSLRIRAQEAIDKKCPIFVTEWGMWSFDITQSELTAWMDLVDKNKLNSAMWSLFDKVEPMSTIKNGLGKVDGNWSEDELTPVGVFIRKRCRGEWVPSGDNPDDHNKGCCSWDGKKTCRALRDWCDEAPANCENKCGGEWKDTSSEPEEKPEEEEEEKPEEEEEEEKPEEEEEEEKPEEEEEEEKPEEEDDKNEGKTCCSWSGKCNEKRGWCDQSVDRCQNSCNGEWFDPLAAPKPKAGCCSWNGDKCDMSLTGWCHESEDRCTGNCKGKWFANN